MIFNDCANITIPLFCLWSNIVMALPNLPLVPYLSQLGNMIGNNIPTTQCLTTELAIQNNFLNFTCKSPVDPILVNLYLACISLLITKDLKTIDIKIDCPKLDINNVSSLFSNCQWCRGKYGCFQVGGPFISVPHPVSLPPQPEQCIGLKLQLYTRLNKDIPFEFDADNVDQISGSHFNPLENSIFLIGGFQNGDFRPYDRDLIDSILSGTNINVFIVNWVKGSGNTYEVVVGNTRFVGAMLAYFINLLTEETNYRYPPNKVHLVGHSLGAQIAGYAGEKIKNLGRITGMDPAGPYFHFTDEVVRLDQKDADLVDIIHTNSGLLGIIENIGHLDFRPNGGTLENGCDVYSRLMDPVLISTIGCEHEKSVLFFINSMPNSNPDYNCTFNAHLCSSYVDYENENCASCEPPNGSNCARMGYFAKDYVLAGNPIPVEGSFYLTTTDQAPYCVDHTP